MSPLQPRGLPVDILIAEDSPTQARRLQHILEQHGYRVSHEANGRLALEAAQRHKPALIISDVVMPEMDGYELCRRVKTEGLGDVPVILVTTLSDPGDVIRGLECRADNFILKPYDEEYLLSRVQFVLMNRVMRQTEQGGLAVDIFFNGQRHTITADRLQILNLLLSTYDAAIQRNKELTRTQEELRKTEGFLNSLFEHIPMPLAVKSASELRYVRLNRAVEELVGQRRSAMLGKTPAEVFGEAQGAILSSADRQVLESLSLVERAETPLQTPSGTRTLHTRSVAIVDEQGTPEYVLTIGEDITARKDSERALAAAKQEAERANRAKSDFLSRMSHDLRTPLNAILGFAQLLDTEELSAEHHDSVRHILKGGAYLLDLINEVLDLARIEAGHLSLSPEPVAVSDIVGHAVALIRPLAAQRGITLNDGVTAACDARHVRADRQRLNQILMNLLSNAVKYNRAGGHVHVTCDDVPEGRLRIKVTDTGAGIPAEQVTLLFQPFERLSAAETGVEGTGLGLALSKALAEAMGGDLGVASEVGQGSTFWVELAGTDAPAEPEVPTRARPDASAPDAAVIGTVLYIEDNLSNQRLMERLLGRRPGVRLVGAATGQAGLDAAGAEAPDLILLDLHLPDLPGDEVLRRLREDVRTRAIPVAMLSADATPAQARRLLAAGATAYLTKPIDINQVLRLLDDKLEERSS